MTKRRRKPLNMREAQVLLRQMTGSPLAFCRRRRGRCEVMILRSIGDYDTYKASGWREALHAAGLFWEPEYD